MAICLENTAQIKCGILLKYLNKTDIKQISKNLVRLYVCLNCQLLCVFFTETSTVSVVFLYRFPNDFAVEKYVIGKRAIPAWGSLRGIPYVAIASWGPSQYKDVVLPVGEFPSKNKTVARPSFPYNANPLPRKTVFILRRAPDKSARINTSAYVQIGEIDDRIYWCC